MTPSLNIRDEVSPLKSVVLGIAEDRGKVVHENNPKISKYLKLGQFPDEATFARQVNALRDTLEREGVNVFRPANVHAQDQIFARDISFVIGDRIVISNMKKKNRRAEQEGIKYILDKLPQDKILYPPEEAFIEGGDVIIHGNYIFVGLGDRTNWEGYRFIHDTFGEFTVIPFEIVVTGNPATNILHLDCTFQPAGDKYALIYEGGFVNRPHVIYDIFGEVNLIKVTQIEMYHMFTNIFSLAPDKIVSESNFTRLNELLRGKGIEVIPVNYGEVSKAGGLFRCSTMPLERV